MKKILVTYPIPKEGLSDLFENFEVFYPEKEKLTLKEISSLINDFEGVITAFGHPFPSEIIEKATKLQIISNYGAGFDNIPIKIATERKILVTNTPDAVTEATAELAIGLMIAVKRRIAECDRKIRSKKIKWGIMENLGSNLFGKTLGIIGMGKIGKATARRASALGLKILYHNRTKLPVDIKLNYNAEYVSFYEILKRSDIISLHTPITEETHYLIGRKEFKMMKPGCILINTARGAVVEEKELVHALKENIIQGAGLDVYEHEPDISDELLEMDQVVLLPHIGTGTSETRIAIARSAVKNLIDFFNEVKPEFMVNPEVWESK